MSRTKKDAFGVWLFPNKTPLSIKKGTHFSSRRIVLVTDPRAASWSVRPPAAEPQSLSESTEPHWPQHHPLLSLTWSIKKQHMKTGESFKLFQCCSVHLQTLLDKDMTIGDFSLQTWHWVCHQHPAQGGASPGLRRLAADQSSHPQRAHPPATAAAAGPEGHAQELQL